MKVATCATCGSHDVRADAYVEWDVADQMWSIAQTFEKGAYCGDCDGETRIEFVELPKPVTRNSHD